MFSPRISTFLLGIFLLQLFLIPVSSTTAESTAEEIIILFDESHKQIYNSTTYSRALQALDPLDLPYKIVFCTTKLNYTTLAGVDLLIITNPASGIAFDEKERFDIGNWLEEGKKGLIMLANPFDKTNASRSSQATLLNSLVTASSLADGLEGVEPVNQLKFYTNTLHRNIVEGNQIKVLDEFAIDTSADSDEPMLNMMGNQVKQVYYSGSALSDELNNKPRNTLVEAGLETYATDENDNIKMEAFSPVVLGSAVTTKNNRILTGGSSVMFSNEICSSTNKTWLESANNRELWQNIVRWTTFQDVPQAIVPPIIFEAVLLLPILAVFGIVAVVVGLTIYTKGVKEETVAVKETTESTEEISKDESKDKQQKRLDQRIQAHKKQTQK